MIHELFEAQVGRTPDAVAVVFEGNKLSYRELNERANGLAHQLRALGIRPNVMVALFLERSLDMVIAMLGVLKAGGAYIPLDPTHPPKRLAYMLADAQPPVLLTQERFQSKLPLHRSVVVVIDADVSAGAHLPQAPTSRPEHSPRDLAYVIYTSGSTGEPKGVEIEHCAVVNMLASMQRRPGFGANDSMLAITTVTFDIAVLEIFLPLVCGARVVIAASKTTTDGEALIDLLEKSGANVMQATPATLRMLLDAGWAGSPRLKVLCGGEAWKAEFANQLLPRCGSLWNMYGPTETTVWSAVIQVEAGQPIVIGPPIANTKFYVLDSALQLVPVGVSGELCIGGTGLARGYLRRPELTRERFVSDPFAADPDARIYRTGDLVRRLRDGTLEFLGRLDNQVKIRGHRIELGEIETALERHSGVVRCVVVAQEDPNGEQCLIAYFIPAAGFTISASELRVLLRETIPAYMIPAAFVSLASFPLTPTGKLDRKALPPPHISAPESDVASLAPRTPTEQALARIWCQMLGLKQVGMGDNFFDLGGYSLLAVRAIAEINKTLKVHLNIPTFFQNQTIAQLVTVLEQPKYHAQPETQVEVLQQGHAGPPLYFVGAGTVEYRIAELIGEHRAIFAIDIPIPVEWFQGDLRRTALPNIEQMGALYGDVLRSHAGSSPCVIVGYSFWGKIAFEAARALRRAGGNVAFVLLIDAFGPRPRLGWTAGGLAWECLLWILRGDTTKTASGTAPINRLSAFWRLLRWLLAQMPHVIRRRIVPESGVSEYLDNDGRAVDNAYINRMRRILVESFHPHPLDAAGVLIRTKFPDEDMLPGHSFTNGWRGLFARGLAITQGAGDHLSIIRDERNIALLARQIDAVLDRYSVDGKSKANMRPIAAVGAESSRVGT